MEAGVILKDLKTPLLIIFECVADYARMLFHTLYSFFAVFLQAVTYSAIQCKTDL